MPSRPPTPSRSARLAAISDLAERDRRAARRSARNETVSIIKPPRAPRLQKRTTQRKVLHRKSVTPKSTPRKSHPKTLAASGAGGDAQTHKRVVIESDGVIPPWASLPFEILLQVFRYAAFPLHDDTFQPTPSVNWLVQTARLCRSFCEPALAALYESPPLFALDKPHRLLDLLRDDTVKHVIDYRTKIKRLELDSVQVLAYKTPGRGSFELSDIIPLLPRLSAIEITNPRNRPPFRRTTARGKWFYTNEIFVSLRDSGIRLDSWRWHGDLLSDRIPELEELHRSTPFSNLRHLTLSNLELLAVDESAPRKRKATISADAVVPLSQLSELVIESCSSATWDLLDKLPGNLSCFTLLNCPDFTTDHLHTFFGTHGKTLRKLILNHNHSLDLTFLPGLALSCPGLETLEIDLTYFSASILGDITHQSDSEPRYDTLLSADDVPSWPSELQQLKILHLRKFSSEAATTFFDSLIAAAPTLPYLRILVVKAMLDISWRERAGFREQWISKLKTAFLRRSKDPDVHLSTKKMFRTWNETSQQRGRRQYTGSSSPNHSLDDSGGPCETVDISIDNMRPIELRFTEDDFMDSEESGDEEWDGGRSA